MMHPSHRHLVREGGGYKSPKGFWYHGYQGPDTGWYESGARANTNYEVPWTIHLNAISNYLPIYLFGTHYTVLSHYYRDSLQADTFGVGLEKNFWGWMTAKVEGALAYWGGHQSKQATNKRDCINGCHCLGDSTTRILHRT